MAISQNNSEGLARGARMLRTALGPAIARFLEDASIVEVMLNPDGRIWIDRLSEGLADTGEHLSPADGERIVRLVAHHVGAEVHAGSPRVSAELPETGERFEGLLPPVVAAPAFAIRGRQLLTCIGQSFGQAIDPDAPVRIQHHLDDGGVFQKACNGGTERRAQHPRAALDRLWFLV